MPPKCMANRNNEMGLERAGKHASKIGVAQGTTEHQAGVTKNCRRSLQGWAMPRFHVWVMWCWKAMVQWMGEHLSNRPGAGVPGLEMRGLGAPESIG